MEEMGTSEALRQAWKDKYGARTRFCVCGITSYARRDVELSHELDSVYYSMDWDAIAKALDPDRKEDR
jgi:hypothetical protein